jgi:hypothetical protein
MLPIWMEKSYSENENRNNKSMAANMEKTILNYKNSHLIPNKYEYRFIWISFENSLRLFTKNGH